MFGHSWFDALQFLTSGLGLLDEGSHTFWLPQYLVAAAHVVRYAGVASSLRPGRSDAAFAASNSSRSLSAGASLRALSSMYC